LIFVEVHIDVFSGEDFVKVDFVLEFSIE